MQVYLYAGHNSGGIPVYGMVLTRIPGAGGSFNRIKATFDGKSITLISQGRIS